MNRLLIGILDIINKLLAIFLIVSSTISGYLGEFGFYAGSEYVAQGPGYRALSTIAGFIVGLVLAALVSGFLATLINISKEATAIREILAARAGSATPPY